MTRSGKTLEHRARQKGERGVGTRRCVSRAKGEAQTTGRGRDPGSRGQAAHLSLRSLLHGARRASSGAQRNRPQRVRVSDVPCRVSSVCSRVEVSGGPKNRGLVIIILRVSRGRRIGGDLESFGKVVASGLCMHTRRVLTGLGQVQQRGPPARV